MLENYSNPVKRPRNNPYIISKVIQWCIFVLFHVKVIARRKLPVCVFTPSEIPSFPVSAVCLAPTKELVGAARALEALQLRARRARASAGWRARAAADMDMIIDDDDVPEVKVDPSIDKALRIKKRQLESMLPRPLFPTGFSFKYPTLNDPNALQVTSEENALQVMKNALESGKLKKDKRKGKNESLLKLGKVFKKTVKI